MLRKILLYLIFLYSLFSIPPSLFSVFAADYRSDYQVEYYLSEANKGIDTRTNFNIRITNLRSDVYVNKFSLAFPKNFVIKDLKAFDDFGEIMPNITLNDSKTEINLQFSHPNIGKESVNNFHLQFTQTNLFQVNGNIWEVILPTIENPPSSSTSEGQVEKSSYKIIVNLPPNTDKKISIAKPKPTAISNLPAGRQVIWDNPSSRTVYAVFGDLQLYELDLSYHLTNPNLFPVYTDVAFPPDTLYQKIYLKSIDPQPTAVYTDEDGNYLGRYFLKPKETVSVSFSGVVELTVKPREEIIPVIRNLVKTQAKYLLSDQKYWKIDKLPESINSSYSIYQYTVNTLKYDYNKIVRKNNRLGAAGALQTPTNAVCVEFSDLFIALAREKGIYSREIEGYGFSKDPQLRPLSLVSDLLHSWPEFYDTKSELWINIDPTWENTSGIDYYNSFDLNHITFAIHGKRSDYPLPAGMYKTEDSRDVSVKATTIKPNELKKIDLSSFDFPARVSDNRIIKTKIVFINKGNIYLWNIPIQIESNILNFSLSQNSIPMLAPFEKKELEMTYSSKYRNKNVRGFVRVFASNNEVFSKSVAVIPFAYDLALKISFIIAFLLFIILLVKVYRSYKH